jgi:hypothetical protein
MFNNSGGGYIGFNDLAEFIEGAVAHRSKIVEIKILCPGCSLRLLSAEQLLARSAGEKKVPC